MVSMVHHHKQVTQETTTPMAMLSMTVTKISMETELLMPMKLILLEGKTLATLIMMALKTGKKTCLALYGTWQILTLEA